MLKTTSGLTNLANESKYNILTIIAAIIASIVSYFTWQYSVGIMV